MDPGADAPGAAAPPDSEPHPSSCDPTPPPSPPAAAKEEEQPHPQQPAQVIQQPPQPPAPAQPSRYESQKRRDWNTFLQYLRTHKPPLTLPRCGGAHVIEFLKYLDQFGKTKVHDAGCGYFGHPSPPAPCTCPLKQAWGSLDALIGRLRAAHEENGGMPESNPFGAKAVSIYLREVREGQAKARGIPYEKKKRKRPQRQPACTATDVAASSSGGAESTAGGGCSAPAASEAKDEGTETKDVEGSVTAPPVGGDPTPPPPPPPADSSSS